MSLRPGAVFLRKPCKALSYSGIVNERWQISETNDEQGTATSHQPLITNRPRSIGIRWLVGTGSSFMMPEVNHAHERARLCSIERSTCTSGRLLASGNDFTVALREANSIGRSSFSRFSYGAAVRGSLDTGDDCVKVVGAWTGLTNVIISIHLKLCG